MEHISRVAAAACAVAELEGGDLIPEGEYSFLLDHVGLCLRDRNWPGIGIRIETAVREVLIAMKKIPTPDQTIEKGRGATYDEDRWTVYQHGVYGRDSVLSGQSRRIWLDDFDTLEEAVIAYPDAVVCAGSTYQPPYLNHLPGEDGE